MGMREKFWKDWSEFLAKPDDNARSQMSFYCPINEFNLVATQGQVEGDFEENYYEEIDTGVNRNLSSRSIPTRRRSSVSHRKRGSPAPASSLRT